MTSIFFPIHLCLGIMKIVWFDFVFKKYAAYNGTVSNGIFTLIPCAQGEQNGNNDSW